MLITLVFVGCLLLGIPVALTLGIAGTAYMIMSDMSLILVPQRMFVQIDSFVLMACPFFILAGALMNEGGFTPRLVRLCKAWLGHVRGGLALVNVAASMFFAGISGSALADTAGIGGILIPAMVKEGYDPDFSAAVTAASSTIGPIIPPSIAFVVYGVCAEVSIAALFLGGVVPGILLGLGQMALSYYYAVVRGYPRSDRSTWKERLEATKDAVFALVGPAIILGGILAGVFTPTEAGVVACIYGALIGVFVFRELDWRSIPRIIRDAAVTTAGVFLLVATAAVFAWAIAAMRVPQQLAMHMASITRSPVVLLLLINAFLLFMGTWMDPTANVIILTPVLLPIVTQLGIDPIFFGVLVVFNVIIGQITPPVGLVLFVACRIAKISLERLSRAILPFIAISVAVLLIMTLIPGLVTFLPRLVLAR